MGRLTEMFDFYNTKTLRSEYWMRQHYSHFEPSADDFALRKIYQESITEKPKTVKTKKQKKSKLKDIFL